MGWLEKMGLVETDGGSPTSEIPEILPEIAEDVDANIDSTANIAENIFAQNDLSDKSNSIYTVQALINTLPPEMTTAKKQATVAGILSVSGKSLGDLVEDANRRLEVLDAAQSKIVDERTTEIQAANADIETLKGAIEAATIRIKESEDIIDATKKSVEDAKTEIESLIEFCKGMEVSQ